MESRLLTVPAAPSTTALALSDVRFAHAVNSAAALDASCASRLVNVLEADVIAGRDGAGAVMGHDPGADHDVTLAAWLQRTAAAGKGAKLDLKQHGVVEDALRALEAVDAAQQSGELPAWPFLRFHHGPSGNGAYFDRPALLINADVLSGSAPCEFNAKGVLLPHAEQVAAAAAFMEAVGERFPSAVLSLGWATAGEGGAYTSAAVDDMLAVVGEAAACGAPITFPVRGSYVVASWPQLRRLLEAGPQTSLTVWSNAPLDTLEEAWMRAHLPPERTMYDLPPPSAVTQAALRGASGGGGSAASQLLASVVGAVKSAVGLSSEQPPSAHAGPASIAAWAAAGAASAVLAMMVLQRVAPSAAGALGGKR